MHLNFLGTCLYIAKPLSPLELHSSRVKGKLGAFNSKVIEIRLEMHQLVYLPYHCIDANQSHEL